MDNDKFYQRQYFDQLTKQVADLSDDLNAMRKDVSDIKSKVIYMYGFAAGVGIVASIIIDWIRTHMLGVAH